MEKQLHEYPIGQPIGLDNPPRLGQPYWRVLGKYSEMDVIPQTWGYAPECDRISLSCFLAYRTKEDALYACRGGHLKEIINETE